MTKCGNFVCLNEASGIKGFRGNFCKRCLASSTPYVFECCICKQTFVPQTKYSRIPMSCSSKCRNRRKYLKNGKAWSKLYAKKHPRQKVKKIAKLCKQCDEPFKCFKRAVFCSKKCNAEWHRTKGESNRHYKFVMKMVAQRLHLQEPQVVLYVPQS